MKRAAIFAALLLATAYAADYLSLRLQIPKRPRTEEVQIRPYYAVPEKDPHREEFMFLDPQTEVCANSLFWQLGHKPCWYVKKHTHKRIDV